MTNETNLSSEKNGSCDEINKQIFQGKIFRDFMVGMEKYCAEDESIFDVLVKIKNAKHVLCPDFTHILSSPEDKWFNILAETDYQTLGEGLFLAKITKKRKH